jgi:hypothetical protein
VLQERLDDRRADPSTMVARSDSDLIDEHLGGLVRMNVVHARRKSDDLSFIDSDRETVATVPKEFRSQASGPGATAAVGCAASTHEVDRRAPRTIVAGDLLARKNVSDDDVGEVLDARVVGAGMVHVSLRLRDQHEELPVEGIQEVTILD